tara:strand:- start:18917 stop:20209 length:1293 start_codon:yes stop_codon:yes gene_type:complete
MKNLKTKMNENFFSNLFDELFPICRSILGKGYTDSLDILNKYIGMKYLKFPSGKKIFDWVVPDEWEIKDAYILTPDKKKICNFKINNLHVMNYSKSINKKLELNELKKILYSLKKTPKAIPYTFSYYEKRAGFNVSFNEQKKLKKGRYHAVINSKFKKGNLIVGTKNLKGASKKKFLITSYLCHPSMANNELSGPLVLLGLYNKINNWKKRNLNYEFLLNPETIGSLCYLNKHKKEIKKNLSGGLVLTCLGGPKKKLSFKKAKNENCGINKFFEYFKKKNKFEIREYDPIKGSDERQYCSSGFDLPVGQVSRTIYREYKEYHTSLDDKKFMTISKIVKSIDELDFFLKIYDQLSGKLIIKNKYGEVFLSKHNLYIDKNSNKLTKSILYILSCSDEENALIDLVIKYNLDLYNVCAAVEILEKKKIIKIIK